MEKKATLPIADIWAMIRNNNWWYVVSVMLFLSLAVYYLYRTPNTYSRVEKVIVDEDSQSSMMRDLTAFAGYNRMRYGRGTNVDNEIEAFASPDLMEQVVAMLCERHPDGRLLLFGGGSDEMAVFDAWEAKYAQCMNASKRLDGFRQELTLMSRLDVMLSMDSANMHLATLTATPVVSIFGATHPYAGFLGYGMTQDDVVQVDNLDCRPCSVFGNKPCMRGDYACMRRITPEMVVEKVEGRMKDERETPSRPPRGEEWMKDEG
jgi:hypothetical protein